MTEPNHILTASDAMAGGKSSGKTKRAMLRLQKQLAMMGLEGQTIESVLEVLKVFVAGPAGQLLMASVVIHALKNIKFFNDQDESAVWNAILLIDFAALGVNALQNLSAGAIAKR